MGILSGALTVRRFRVLGEVPEGFRDDYRARLTEYAFKEPPVGQGKEEVEGWVQVHNLLDAEFDDFEKWLYFPYALFALRVDKKSLPAKLFRAHLEKKIAKWCAENDRERCPASTRTQLKEELEQEWLARALPKAAVTEVVWKIDEGWLLLHAHSEGVAERFRKRFFQTFGMKVVPWSPLDWVADAEAKERLLHSAPSFGAEVAE